MDGDSGAFASGQRMPPYSTDPSLCLARHADPDYSGSSDYIDSTSDTVMLTYEDDTTLLPSSPPKQNHHAYDQNNNNNDDDDDDDDDDLTDDDELAGTSATREGSRWAPRAAHSESTVTPGSFILAARAESSTRLSPEKLIAKVFDSEGHNDINLDGRGLDAVPEACRDLTDHEDLGSRKFKIDLTGNCIRKLNRFLYDIKRLEYLSLRLNQVDEISPLICRLTELKELHLGNNRLKSLPSELLRLRKLETLTTYPNEFIPALSDNTDVVKGDNTPPSLAELCKRAIARAGFSQRYADFEKSLNHIITQNPEIMLARLLEPVLEAVYVGRVCSSCGSPIVNPAFKHIRWMKHDKNRSGDIIPFSSIFCSLRCWSTFRTQHCA